MALVDRFLVNTVTTGTGDIALGASVTNAYLDSGEANLIGGEMYTWLITDTFVNGVPSDFETIRAVYDSTADTILRDGAGRVLNSKVGGTAGTSKLDLSGSAQVAAVAATIDIVPIGALVALTGSAEPWWGAFPDGATYNRADYPSWWDWISNESGNLAASEGAKTDGEYGPGDGSTTFTIPDLASANRYIRMADGSTLVCGDLQADAAPDITGSFETNRAHVLSPTGAFTVSGSLAFNTNGTATGASTYIASFAASNSNAKYGGASEIRPISVAYPFVIVHGGKGS